MSNLAIRLGEITRTLEPVTQYFNEIGLCVANSPTLTVAGGINNGGKYNMAFSPNQGALWYPANNNFFTQECRGVAYSSTQNRWVAVGGGDNGSIAYSDDGMTWLPAATTNFFTLGRAVAFGNGRWVAVGNGVNGSIAYSNDGITWTASTNLLNVGRSVAYSQSQGKWVVVGEGVVTIGYSIDNGITFLPSDDFFQTGRGNSVAFGNGNWVAFGTNDTVNNTRSIGNSVDGITWVAATNFYPGTGMGVSVAFGNGYWIGSGYDPFSFFAPEPCYSFDNGQTWYPNVNAYYIFGGAVWTGNWFVTVGIAESFTILLTPDGTYYGNALQFVSPGVPPNFLVRYPQ